MTEPQQWDIVSGLGITALGAAAARALESSRPDRLMVDPYAAAFVRAAGSPLPMLLRWPDDFTAVSEQDALLVHGSHYVGLRSRYFDDHLLAAGADGTGQVVVLAAGLDTRAYRLDWPPGVRLYELDQPKVLEFKDTVLRRAEAQVRCDRVPVAVDLREDWPAALRSAGFDPARRTAWLAEGLLPYLPPDEERLLFERVDALSAPGSRLAAEHTVDVGGLRATGGLRRIGEAGVDMEGMVATDGRSDFIGSLGARGWTTVDELADVVARRYHRDPDDPRLAALPGTGLRFGGYHAFLSASRDGATGVRDG